MKDTIKSRLKIFNPELYPNENGIILLDKEKIIYPIYSKMCLETKLDNNHLYLKHGKKSNLLFGLISSRLFNHANIPTPHAILTKDKEKDELLLGLQDIKELADLDIYILQGDQVKKYKDNFAYNMFTSVPSKWSILYNKHEREILLEIMTPECLEQFIDILLIDEIRADNDRHWGNIFFYKRKDAEKFEGIIPIDIDNTRLYRSTFTNPKLAYFMFKHDNYKSWTTQQYTDRYQTYSERMNAIRKLLCQGFLPNSNIQTLRKAVEYNFADEMKKVITKHNITDEKNLIYELCARQEKSNKSILGKELGL